MTKSHSTMHNMPQAKMKIFLLFVVLVIGVIIVFAIMIYKGFFPQGYLKSRELEQNQAKWESQHITHYQMSVNEYGYGVLSATVEVKDGNIVSVVGSTQGEKENIFTIPGLFSYVAKTYSEDPPEIRVTYDQTFGYPTSIYIDPYTEPCCQDFTIEVKDFHVLSP